MSKGKKASIFILAFVLLFGIFCMGVQAASVTSAKSYSLKKVTAAPTVSGKWMTQSGKMFFVGSDGKNVKSKWIRVDGNIYYLNKKGNPAKGWIKYRGKYYYTNSAGKLVFGWLNHTYYLQADGSRAAGLTAIDDSNFFFDKKKGTRKTGWIKIGKAQYFFDKASGKMLKSSWIPVGKDYAYVGSDGKRQKACWLTLGANKYYLDKNGIRVTGEYWINNKAYYFKKDGVYDPSVVIKSDINPNKPMVALTFDDGPGPYTMRLLNCLERNHAKATFFMVGQSVGSHKSAVKKMVAIGCELGNHSYNHANLAELSTSSIQSQISRTNNAIKAACGSKPTVARLPYGSGHNNGRVLGALGLPSIYWSIDTRDWANTGSSQHTVNAVLNSVRSGDIVLMHDIHNATVTAAEKIIPALKKRGYQMVTVSQLAKYKKHTTIRAGKTYYSFR